MSAVLSACCRCGAVVTVPCPTLLDIDGASAAMAAQGWRWDDREGHRCPAYPSCPEYHPPRPPEQIAFPLGKPRKRNGARGQAGAP